MLSFRLPSTRILTGAILSLALLLISAGCGGSSSGGGGGPVTPQPGVTFSEDGSPTANTIFMTDSPSGSTTLTLEIRANDMDHVRGFAFDVVYPTNLLTFQSATMGSFLGDEAVVDLLASERTAGTVVVGLTRFGSNRTVISGSGLIVTLTFATAGAGSGPIEFRNEQAFREFSSITAANWLGGTVTVTR